MTRRRVRSLHTFEAFGNRGYRLLWPANFLAYTSRWMQMTLLGWLVLGLTDSPFLVALVGVFGTLPLLMLGMIGGLLADRVNRRRLLIATQAMSWGAAVFMVVVLQTEMVRFWHAYLASAVTGVGWALDMPSRRSVIHDLIGRAKVTNAIAMDDIIVAGKTGTAEAAERRKGASKDVAEWLRQDHAWFAGYAPATRPEIVVAVLLEHGGSGGKRAAPVFRNIVKKIFDRRLNLPTAKEQ